MSVSLAVDNESRRDKFLRLGKRRMLKALQAVRLLGNLSSSNYHYSPRDVELMRWTLIDQLDKTFAKFNRPTHTDIAFEFPATEEASAPPIPRYILRKAAPPTEQRIAPEDATRSSNSNERQGITAEDVAAVKGILGRKRRQNA